jgi:putative sterol carrier protein
MTIQNYFDNLSTKINPDDLEGIDTKINFDLKGQEVFLEVKDKKITVHQGQADNAEVNIKASPDDLLSIIKGDTNPMMAMMMGKLKISNPGAMMKYAKILGLM